ncbi:hypothetical protein JCM33374_g1606 [Metschnikowia sp. JCM 33374]|nr:hypothetical protein JCM33374_g1606 [Metschnikowia sp. JCM 33374]
MDINKQYPNLALDNQNDSVFDIESLSSRLGLSVIDIMHLARSCDRKTAENLSARSGTPVEEIFRLLHTAKKHFLADLQPNKSVFNRRNIPTTLTSLDESLQGGIPLGEITEVFGASGCGKSQFLLWLAVRAQMLDEKNKQKVENTCIYISTEAILESRRLSDFSKDVPGALERISYIYCPDLENQDHILFTQLRLKLQEDQNAGRTPRMVIIDSVGHHLRAEDTFLNTSVVLREHLAWQELQLENVPMYHEEKVKFDRLTNQFSKGDIRFRNRTSKKYYLFTLYRHLSELARTFNVAVVLANQVSDVVDQTTDGSRDQNQGPGFEDPLELDFQIGPFSGWDASSLVSFPERASGSAVTENQGHRVNDRKRKATENDNATTQSERDEYWNHQLQNSSGPKKKVPAMGYTWSKLITHRVLLWKTYEAVFENADGQNYQYESQSKTGQITETHNFEGENSEGKNSAGKEQNLPENLKNLKNSKECSSKLDGFKIRRFARAVSSRVPARTGPTPATCEFQIKQTGIYEVRGAPHVT